MDSRDTNAQARACRKLWAAVLASALRDLQNKPKYGAAASNRHMAQTWIDSDESSPSSFVWVCRVLEIDPERTRTAIYKHVGSMTYA
ncbi:hypothetical protein LCGC14_2097710 [marine sediment metagenome]|uniref:Uncharacterized protein n=1 Tax=marine sediment metagenome TaxID=412755 RepID=A0A0F9EY24_9ZZZZ